MQRHARGRMSGLRQTFYPTDRQFPKAQATLRPSSLLLMLKTFAQVELIMSQTTTMTVRISGALSEFVASNVGENGAYENISEYVRDLIRRDKERIERESFDRLKAELTRSFAAPEDSYRLLTAAEVISRNRG
jgi:antitoxin ParD1/3/4